VERGKRIRNNKSDLYKYLQLNNTDTFLQLNLRLQIHNADMY